MRCSQNISSVSSLAHHNGVLRLSTARRANEGANVLFGTVDVLFGTVDKGGVEIEEEML
jgi:hypothetical protein